MLNPKQKEVVECIKTEDPKILICYGAKRAGKTYILIWAFLHLISRFKNKGMSFILAGASQGALRRNVLSELEKILGRDIKLDRANSFPLFGNRIYCFEGTDSDSWKKVRGFTAAGAFINEGTALNDIFIKEVISRCSVKGSRIYIDTNPENPTHSLKIDYIDKDGQTLSGGKVNIRAFHFTLFDNTALDPEYVESIISATPKGMFADRDIYGKWVSPDGIIYRDFSDKLILSSRKVKRMRFTEYFAGVDWGYEHYGAIIVVGVNERGQCVVVEERAARHKEIDYWLAAAKDITGRYGNIKFYCDSARPEYVRKFFSSGLRAENGAKSVLSGIESVAGRFKRKELFICEAAKRLLYEISLYVWNPVTGEPIKVNDDALDALRYAVYSKFEAKAGTRVISKKTFLGGTDDDY